jgi:hypothetical protein
MGVDDRSGAVAPVDAQMQVEFGGRLQCPGHGMAVQVDHRDLIRGEFGEHRSGRGDRDPVRHAHADVSGRPDEQALGPQTTAGVRDAADPAPRLSRSCAGP